MKRIVLLVFFMSLLAFSMQVEQIDMAKEAVSVGDTYNVEGLTNNFPTDQKIIYGVVKYTDASLQDSITIKWIAEDAINIPNYEIAKTLYHIDKVSGVMRASLNLSAKSWPKGHYRLEIYKGSQKIAEKHFSIGMPKEKLNQSEHITQLFLATYAGINKDGYIDTKGVADTFEVTQRKLFAIVAYKDLKVPGKFTFEWYVEKAGDVTNQRILSNPIENTRATGAIYGQIELDDTTWPTGDFRVDILYDGKQVASKHFKMLQTTPPGTKDPSIIKDLISSKWIDRSTAKPLVLSFPSRTQFNYGESIFECTIDEKVIKVQGNKGLIIFPYNIENNKLYLELNGNTGVFERMKPSTKPAVTPIAKLTGKYCSSKNKSNEWITFDGAGHFSFGSLANSIVAAQGTYALHKEWINVLVKGENLGKIHITKQNNVRINAFEFDHITYTRELCPR